MKRLKCQQVMLLSIYPPRFLYFLVKASESLQYAISVLQILQYGHRHLMFFMSTFQVLDNCQTYLLYKLWRVFDLNRLTNKKNYKSWLANVNFVRMNVISGSFICYFPDTLLCFSHTIWQATFAIQLILTIWFVFKIRVQVNVI